MPVTSDFDRYFLNLPPFDREGNFDKFWDKSVEDLKKISIEPSFKINKDKSSFRTDVYDVAFKGFLKSNVTGELYLSPGAKKPRVVILVHDYNRPGTYPAEVMDRDLAFMVLRLRGHDILKKKPVEGEAEKTPGYMVESIMEPDDYYVKGIYLDALRTIDVLRLNSKLDCSAMGIMGKGLGAAAGLFAAACSRRVAALVLDAPSFSYLPASQNLSNGDASSEINEYILHNKSRKKQIKKNMTYFDAINFSDRVRCPVLVTVGFKDTVSPPECVFALFNHLLCEKSIEVYPEEGNEAGGKVQMKKSIRWMKDILNSIP